MSIYIDITIYNLLEIVASTQYYSRIVSIHGTPIDRKPKLQRKPRNLGFVIGGKLKGLLIFGRRHDELSRSKVL